MAAEAGLRRYVVDGEGIVSWEGGDRLGSRGVERVAQRATWAGAVPTELRGITFARHRGGAGLKPRAD